MKRTPMFTRIDRCALSRNRNRRSRAMSAMLALTIGAGNILGCLWLIGAVATLIWFALTSIGHSPR